MTEISENPVLNPRAAAQLRFETLEPEIQQKEILALPAPPPESPEDSSAAAAADESANRRNERREDSSRRTANSGTGGRHRKADPPANDKAEKAPAPPKIRPPDFREWHDFGANFVFKWLCRGYVGYVFRGIDKERVLNAAELDALEPDAEMLSSATKPLAHMAARSEFMRKNGRAIIDSADGIEALIAVGMYANTVRRIARSHEQQRTIQPSQRK